METFVGETVKIVLKTGIDLSGYADLRMRFRRPDGTTGEWISSVSGTNTTWMEYTTLTGDLNVAGLWAVEAFAADTGILLRGKPVDFMVYLPISLMYLASFGASAPPAAGSLTPASI